MGASGSGKTTVLLAISGLVQPFAGRHRQLSALILAPLRRSERDRFRGLNIGFVFQNLNLIAGLQALENVLIGPFAAGVKQDRRRAIALLEEMGLAELHPPRCRGHEPRPSPAWRSPRAMLLRPKIILADEPTASLDDESCAVVGGLLAQAMSETGAALLIATHDRRLRELFPRSIPVQELA